MEGFEGEILILLKIMRERKLQKGKLDGRKRKNWSRQIERELKKLKCTVNYFRGGGEGGWGVVVASLDEDSFAFMECKRS